MSEESLEEIEVIEDEDPDLGEEVNPYEVPVIECDVIFTTHVSDVSNLGEAAEVMALNIIRFGLDSYYVLYTDTDTGKQWVSNGGTFAEAYDPVTEGDLIPDDSADT